MPRWNPMPDRPTLTRLQTAVAACCVCVSVAAASDASQSIAEEETLVHPFNEMDLNHDGVLSFPETRQSTLIRNRWSELDVNQDGVLDRSEIDVLTEGTPSSAVEADR